VGEASSADADVLGIRRAGDENALVYRLQPDVEVDLGTVLEGDDALAPLLGERDGEAVLAHLARMPDDVADGHHEGAVYSSLHVSIVPADAHNRLALEPVESL